MQHNYQSSSKIPITARIESNTPLLPRVVTLMTGLAASPRVPARTKHLSPRNFSQEDFWNLETSKMAIALGANHWSQLHFANAVVHPVTGKQMEYMALMKYPDLQPLWKRGFSNEAGRLFQGIHNIPRTNTCFFVELKNIPKDRKITYGIFFVTTSLTKKEKNA
jgi:hypothetical protein